MEGTGAKDGERVAAWGRVSDDYDRYRPPYPASLFDAFGDAGVELRGARVCDLGAGTGSFGLELARRGASVVGVDLAAAQLARARARAEREGLAARCVVASAERTGLASGAFDVVTAAQCFLYFEHPAIDDEVGRLLAPGGVLATAHFSWLPRESRIASASEALVLELNPDWSAADWPGEFAIVPPWARGRYDLVRLVVFDVDVPFTRETWRGRFRACRGSGASLDAGERAEFDRRHAEMLERVAPERFTVPHRADLRVLRPRSRS